MTRINVGLHPKLLPSKQLLAEHREITRIPNAVKTHRANMSYIPSVFCLGPGHVKFFYDKLGYLAKRYTLLLKECQARGFDVTDKSQAFEDLPTQYMRDYQPTAVDRALIIDRLLSKGVVLDNYQSQNLV